MSRKYLAVGLLLIALISGIAGAFLTSNNIYTGITMEGTEVGGLSIDQARIKLAEREAELAQQPIILTCEGHRFEATIHEIGGRVDSRKSAEAAHGVGRQGNAVTRLIDMLSARFNGRDVSVAYVVEKDKALRFLQSIAGEINRPPSDASIAVVDGSVKITPERHGLTLDLKKSLARMEAVINLGEREMELVVTSSHPKLTTSRFQGIDGILSQYTTNFRPWEKDRTHNLKLACQAVDGTLIKPGERFSYNQVVGPRLSQNGYRNAPIFVKGQVEPGMGGGICQISTTVYNAALLGDLKIIKRTPHSRPVDYAPIGRDATVIYPNVDLVFENDTGAPIYVAAKTGSQSVTVTLLGKVTPDRKVELVAVGHRKISPATVTGTKSSAGRAGHRVSIQRVVKVGDEVVKRETISNNYYPPENRVIVAPEPEPEPEPEEL